MLWMAKAKIFMTLSLYFSKAGCLIRMVKFQLLSNSS